VTGVLSWYLESDISNSHSAHICSVVVLAIIIHILTQFTPSNRSVAWSWPYCSSAYFIHFLCCSLCNVTVSYYLLQRGASRAPSSISPTLQNLSPDSHGVVSRELVSLDERDVLRQRHLGAE
jgi:hypothetical protein